MDAKDKAVVWAFFYLLHWQESVQRLLHGVKTHLGSWATIYFWSSTTFISELVVSRIYGRFVEMPLDPITLGSYISCCAPFFSFLQAASSLKAPSIATK